MQPCPEFANGVKLIGISRFLQVALFLSAPDLAMHLLSLNTMSAVPFWMERSD